MGFSLFGFVIGGLLALTLLVVGAIGLFGRKAMGQQVRSLLGIIPLGNPKLWSAIILILGLAGGGIAVGTGFFTGLGSGITTASITGQSQDAVVSNAKIDCKFSTISTSLWLQSNHYHFNF